MCNICKCLLFLSVKASPGCIIGHLMEDAAIRGRIFAPFPSIPPTVYHSIPQYAAYHPPATKPKNGLCDQIYQYHLPVTDFRPWWLLPAVRVSANSNLRPFRKSTQCWFPDIEKMCPLWSDTLKLAKPLSLYLLFLVNNQWPYICSGNLSRWIFWADLCHFFFKFKGCFGVLFSH